MAPAYGLYSHIQANRYRSIVLIAGLFLLVYLLLFAFLLLLNGLIEDEASLGLILQNTMDMFWPLAPFATAAALIWVAIGYFFHQRMIDASTGAKDVTREAHPKLYNLLENLCISRGIAMPRLQIIETDALNAYASGMHEKQYRVALTSGLIKTLNDQEIEAVLAHELSHIRNGDVRLMVVAIIIAGIVTLAGELVFRTMGYARLDRGGSSGRGNQKGGGAIAAILIAVLIIAIAWFLSLVIRLALSRSREYLADAGAIELTKNPDAMISALRKIEGRSAMVNVPSGIQEMCIDNKNDSIADMFSTHPSVDARIERLVSVAGGHDPGKIETVEHLRNAKELEEPAA